MRKLTCILLFAGCLLAGSTAFAQSSQGNGNSGSNNPNVHQQMPMSRVVDILQAAQPYFQSQLGLSLGQLIQKYHRCECTITQVEVNVYRVEVPGGGLTIITIDDGF